MKPQNSLPENCGGISFLDNNEKNKVHQVPETFTNLVNCDKCDREQ